MRYTYTILMDGNGKFVVRRKEKTWWFPLTCVAYENTKWNPDTETYDGLGDYDWNGAVIHPTRFDDIRKAVQVLELLRARDRRKQQSREFTVVMKEEL
mgnify:CR=1 FL=1